MLLLIILISLGVLSMGLLVASAWFWFPLWRSKKSGIAHGLFLSNATLAVAVLFRLIRVIYERVGSLDHMHSYSLVVATLILAVAIFNFSLSRGYFNQGEENDR